MEYIPTIPSDTKPMTNREKFLKVCLDALDTEVSPNNPVPNEVSCARDMSILINKAIKDFKTQDSTILLNRQILNDKRFERIEEPEIGSIWIYVSKTDIKGNITMHGHVWTQISSNMLASNNSFGINAGKYTGNYTLEKADKEYGFRRKLNKYMYRLKD